MLSPAVWILLVFACLLPAALSWLLDRLRLCSAFRSLSDTARQLIYGGSFGVLAICLSLLGAEGNGAQMEVQNAAPICAGLLFGTPAGIYAGLIGGIFRLFLHGEHYAWLACAITSAAAGICAGCIRKWMFDDKRPKWYYGFSVGVVVEILHMLMIILTHMGDIHTAFTVVRASTLPTLLATGLAVMLAVAALSLQAKDFRIQKSGPQNITQSFGIWLLTVVLVAFALTTAFSWAVETRLSVTDAVALLKLNMRDVRQDIVDASDENLLQLTRQVAEALDAMPEITQAELDAMQIAYDVAEINVVDELGRIVVSTQADFHGYNMAYGAQSGQFLALLDGKTTSIVQSYQPISYDETISRKYAGMTLARGGFVQVAYDAQRFQRDIDGHVIGVTKNRHIGDSGFLVIADENGVIVSDRHESTGKTLAEIGIDLSAAEQLQQFRCVVHDKESFCIYAISEGYTIVAAIPCEEVLISRDVSLYLTIFMEAVIFAALYVLIYHLIKTRIVDNIRRINASLAEITGGDLDVVVDVRSNEEFASLSDDINATVVTLKRYIDEAAARLDQELEFARTIQHSALPGVFPPFPTRNELDIYAQMFTAKEVGGDFYDFYFVDPTHLAFLVADVSGKGIPAAMFMMTAKTLLKNYAESGREVQDVFTLTNEKLCESNEANMFVTAWMGILDLKTGIVDYANAGHNPPLLRHGDGSFEYLRSRPGLVLAGMEGIRYRQNSVSLAPGDALFLYTDGVTEANDASGTLYGEARLLQLLNSANATCAQALCEAVRQDLDGFVGSAPQFDDITMLALRYLKEAAE